mmetsp:Transcript_50975/g.157778  ORF Transcript_50975/g.157778 Transcript_50975/m.157778 type:complete len:226 (+) Transcript_50975:165-842(+)
MGCGRRQGPVQARLRPRGLQRIRGHPGRGRRSGQLPRQDRWQLPAGPRAEQAGGDVQPHAPRGRLADLRGARQRRAGAPQPHGRPAAHPRGRRQHRLLRQRRRHAAEGALLPGAPRRGGRHRGQGPERHDDARSGRRRRAGRGRGGGAPRRGLLRDRAHPQALPHGRVEVHLRGPAAQRAGEAGDGPCAGRHHHGRRLPRAADLPGARQTLPASGGADELHEVQE